MPAEGMVHALRRACDLLSPAGTLVDLHPTPADATLHARYPDGHSVVLGDLIAEDAHDRHARADAALAEAMRTGILDRKHSLTFTFARETDTLDELIAFVSGKWNGRFDWRTDAEARRSVDAGATLVLREEVAAAAFRRR